MTDSHPRDASGDRPHPDLDDPHLDLDALADHLAGQVEAAGHLASCGGCTARLAELEAARHLVQRDLRALPAPEAPQDVADRIGALLAAEPPLTAEPPPGTTSADEPAGARPSAPEATVLPLDERRRRPWLPSVAAGVVLLAGGLLGYAVVAGRTPGGQQAESAATGFGGAAPDQAPPVPTVRSGLDYADADAVRAAVPRILAGTAGPASSGTADRAPAASSPTSPAPSRPPADPLTRLRDPVALADCLASLQVGGQPPDLPLALDYAAYAGAPALAVVLADPDPAKVQVFLLGPRCSRADGDLRHVLFVRRP